MINRIKCFSNIEEKSAYTRVVIERRMKEIRNTSSKHDVPSPATKPCCEDEIIQCLSRKPFMETNTNFSKICDMYDSIAMGRYDNSKLRGPPLCIGTPLLFLDLQGNSQNI